MDPLSQSGSSGSDASGGSDRTDDLPPTVFVVDDDASFAKGIERMLRASGYAVSLFTSAADFLARRPAGAVGCVVADLKMPGMDGMMLQQALAQSDDPLPIVFLTGHGDIPTSVTAMRRGAEDFLTKTAPRDSCSAPSSVRWRGTRTSGARGRTGAGCRRASPA